MNRGTLFSPSHAGLVINEAAGGTLNKVLLKQCTGDPWTFFCAHDPHPSCFFCSFAGAVLFTALPTALLQPTMEEPWSLRTRQIS